MDWKSALQRILDFLFKTGLARFFSGLVGFGVGLLSVAWTDVFAALIGVVFQQPESAAGVAQIVGICLILGGIVGRISLEVVTMHRERQREVATKRQEQRRLAMTLIRRLHVLVAGFEDAGVGRESAYYDNEIVQCAQAANDFLKVAPDEFSANPVLAGIQSPKFDTSKKEPYYPQPTLKDVRDLIAKLEANYDVERR